MMKKFIILPITIFVCVFLLGFSINTGNSNPRVKAFAFTNGIYTSTDELEPIEEETAELPLLPSKTPRAGLIRAMLWTLPTRQPRQASLRPTTPTRGASKIKH